MAIWRVKKKTIADSSYPGVITGLEFNLDTDASHDIFISPGICMDDTNKVVMEVVTGFTKQVDASWAAGDDAGGLDGTESSAGTPDANTIYALWLIMKGDGTVDALFSESMTAPTMPSNYIYKRFIGYVWINASNNIKPFVMTGNTVLFTKASETILFTVARAQHTGYGAAGNPVDLSSYLPVGHYSRVELGAQSTGDVVSFHVSLDGVTAIGSVGGQNTNIADSQGSSWYQSRVSSIGLLNIQNDQIYLDNTGSVNTNNSLLIRQVELLNR